MAHNKLYRNFIILQEDEKTHAASGEKALSGYAKIEAKGDKCKISFYAQNLNKEEKYSVLLICYKKDMKQIVDLGVLEITDSGKGESSNEYYVSNIAGLDFSYEKISGAAICKYSKGEPIFLMYGFMNGENVGDSWKKCKLLKHGIKNEEVVEKKPIKIKEDKKEQQVKPEHKDHEEKEHKDHCEEKEHKEECEVCKEECKENVKVEKKKEEEKHGECKGEKHDECKEEHKHKKDDECKEECKEDVKVEKKKEEEKHDECKGEKHDECKEECKEAVKVEKKKEEKKHDECKEDHNHKKDDDGKEVHCEEAYSYKKKDTENMGGMGACKKRDEVESAEYRFEEYEAKIVEEKDLDPYDFEMRGELGAFFENIVKGFEEVKDNFKEIKYCKWYKVKVNSLDDMCNISNYNKYTIAYYPMLNYYPYIKKYGYFMIGYKCDERGNLKYIVYGVPGSKDKDEQPYVGKTGFVTWISDNKDREGCWLMFYDYKNSTVVVPMK